MKKFIFLFLLIAFLLSVPHVQSQTSAGTVLLGLSSSINLAGSGTSDLMSLGFSRVKYKSNATGYTEPDPDKGSSLGLTPRFGVFVVENLAIGLDLNLSYSHSTDGTDPDSKYTSTLLMAGPFVRYYVPAGTVFPFLEGSAVFGTINSKSEYTGGSTKNKSGLHSFAGGMGVAAPLGKNATVDIMAQYSSISVKDKDNNPDDERMVVGAFGFRVGFTLYLGAN